jgi:hypothetical protein
MKNNMHARKKRDKMGLVGVNQHNTWTLYISLRDTLTMLSAPSTYISTQFHHHMMKESIEFLLFYVTFF